MVTGFTEMLLKVTMFSVGAALTIMPIPLAIGPAEIVPVGVIAKVAV